MRQFASVYPGIALDVIEREPAVIELARCWYDLDSIPGLTVHIADGIDFIAGAASDSWDVVVIDAYDTSTLAHDFTQQAFFADLQHVLSPGGAMAINLIGTLDGYGPLPAITRAVRAGFSSVRVVPVMGAAQDYAPSALRNIVVVATTR